MFIVLEGIDASGKTTVSKLLATKIGGIVYKTPPEKYRLLRHTIDVKPGTMEHYIFYRDSILEASIEIGNLLQGGNNIICDRYWLSTVVYHRAGNLDVDSSDFSGVIVPDLTVFFYVSPVEQVKRSSQRYDDICSDITGKQLEITNLYWQELLKSGLSFITINTDNIQPEQSVNIIVNAIL